MAALMDLFVALGDMEQQQLGGAVDPNPLREALSSDMKSHFRIGKACCKGGHILAGNCVYVKVVSFICFW